YLEQGSAGLAKEQAELALRLDPDLPDGYFVLGVANYRIGEYAASVENLVTASETEGQFATFYMEVFMALADAHEALGDYESALAAYSEALKRGPTNALVYIERGLMFERAERWYDAAADFAYALVFIDDNQEALDGLARIEQSSPEDYARARKDIDAVRAQLVPHAQVNTPTAE
ncbi:MAG TPA: tetratricopeptide repeat protein, partial [Coriobacteriia bacterium]|nr:tetratricopeptide repeat protein [Coriobacteriia bacterium]